MFFGKKCELDGAWEERGVLGTRIEIEKGRITVLWQNAPVLETTYKTEKRDGKTYLKLAKRGKRYKGAASDYAEITEIVYADNALDVTENFPISGDSHTHLTRTENSRYGDYAIVDDVLGQLQGTWRCDNEYYSLSFAGSKMTFNELTTTVHILRSNGGYPTGFVIADADPSVYEWLGFQRFEFDGGVIRARMPVYDAPAPYVLEFRKE